MTENELKHAVLKIAYERGWIVYHVPMNTVRGSQGKGYPDLTLARDGRVIWMELKQQDGKVKPEQLLWADAVGTTRHYFIRPSHLTDGTVWGILQ